MIDMQSNSTLEILDIAQEECAEVIQAISKVKRFGIDSRHPDYPETNQDNLEMELGDLLAMIALIESSGLVRSANITMYKEQKLAKLKKWSNIFNT